MGENNQTTRIARLREKLCDTLPEICIERACLLTQSYRETEAYPEIIRRAKALEKILSSVTIRIEEDELIVGHTISKRRGGIVTPEINVENCREAIEAPTTSSDEFAPIPEDYISRMQDVMSYWKGKALFDRVRARVPGEILNVECKTMIPSGSSIANNYIGSHMSVDYSRLLAKGLKAIKAETEEKLAALDPLDPATEDSRNFYTAVIITLQAACDYSRRYAGLAREMAGKEKDPQRAEELLHIAENCEWVLSNPPRTFYEALQFVWLYFIVLMTEAWGPGMAFGRMDQYLYPYYKKDIESGIMTREQAQELLGCFCIKMNESGTRFSFEKIRTGGGLSVLSDITIGGVTKDGRDAVNDLTYLFLDVQEEVRMFADEVVIRISNVTPDKFVFRACEAARNLRGKFKFIGDETAVSSMLFNGLQLEDAREFALSGCSLPTVPGVSWDIIGGLVNLPLMVELALNNGYSPVLGEQIGAETGDPREFRSFEDVWEAYKKQVEFCQEVYVRVRNADRAVSAEYAATPFQSAGYQRCLDSGRDLTWGGSAPYVTDAISAIGGANACDSLAVIKKLIFEDKKITMDQLLEAMKKDFEGEEELLKLIDSVPKFGNDDDYADSIMVDIYDHFEKGMRRFKGYNNNKYTVQSYTAGGYLILGENVGALPDGRKAGIPISDGGASPYHGRNLSGATATFNSVNKIDIVKLSSGVALNMKFSPSLLKDAECIRKFAALLRGYFEKGGFHVQFNIVSSAMLLDAMKHPEKYRDLLVRVATYSALFTNLGPELQLQLVDRVENTEV